MEIGNSEIKPFESSNNDAYDLSYPLENRFFSFDIKWQKKTTSTTNKQPFILWNIEIFLCQNRIVNINPISFINLIESSNKRSEIINEMRWVFIRIKKFFLWYLLTLIVMVSIDYLMSRFYSTRDWNWYNTDGSYLKRVEAISFTCLLDLIWNRLNSLIFGSRTTPIQPKLFLYYTLFDVIESNVWFVFLAFQ